MRKAIVSAAVLFLAGCMSAPSGSDNHLTVAERFERIAFYDEGDSTPKPLHRWAGPIRYAGAGDGAAYERYRSEERRVGKEVSVRVDLGGRRIIKKKNRTQTNISNTIQATVQ